MASIVPKSRRIVCENCGKSRRTQHKTRDICLRCYCLEPTAVCAHCGHKRHCVDEATGWCPHCKRLMNHPGKKRKDAVPTYEFICRGCGQRRRHRRRLGSHGDLCQGCYAKEPSIPCQSCGMKTRRADKTTNLCPGCIRKLTRPLGTCSGCSKSDIIFDEDRCLCRKCHSRRLYRLSKETLKIKVTCESCGELRRSVLVDEKICQQCYMKKVSNYQLCAGCGLEKLIWVKKGLWCKHCYGDHIAAMALKKFVDAYKTPYHSNKKYFDDLIATTIDWSAVDERTNRRFRAFGKFLQTTPLEEPLTWEKIQTAMPPLVSNNRTNLKHVRSCLLDLGHLLVAKRVLEKREEYLARRIVRHLITCAPAQIQEYLRRYVDWLYQRRNTPSTIRCKLVSINPFWWWCDHLGIKSPLAVNEDIFNQYLQYLSWKRVCQKCHHAEAFDVYVVMDTGACPKCDAPDTLIKIRRHSHDTVVNDCRALVSFFDWAQINKLVLINPVECEVEISECEARHYSPDVILRLCQYIVSPEADPMEALTLYLIIFHAFTVWELAHALLPSSPGLAEAYHVLIPRRDASRRAYAIGRPDVRVDFRPLTAHWLKPLLERYERQRRQILRNPQNRCLIVAPGRARHDNPVCKEFIRRVVKRGSTHAWVGECSPKRLRGTAGVIFADTGGTGMLVWMGWSAGQGFRYTWMQRRIVHPRQPHTSIYRSL
jgi:hypothetical protein